MATTGPCWALYVEASSPCDRTCARRWRPRVHTDLIKGRTGCESGEGPVPVPSPGTQETTRGSFSRPRRVTSPDSGPGAEWPDTEEMTDLGSGESGHTLGFWAVSFRPAFSVQTGWWGGEGAKGMAALRIGGRPTTHVHKNKATNARGLGGITIHPTRGQKSNQPAIVPFNLMGSPRREVRHSSSTRALLGWRNGDLHCSLGRRDLGKSRSLLGEAPIDWPGTAPLPVRAGSCELLLLSARNAREKAKTAAWCFSRLVVDGSEGAASTGDLPQLQAIWGGRGGGW